MDVGAEPDDLLFGAVHHFELEGRASVVVPDFDRVDAVPVRAFAARQQEINRRGGGAAVDHTGSGARASARMMSVAVFCWVTADSPCSTSDRSRQMACRSE